MNNLLYILDLVGTVAFAISGALAGVRKKMDLYGIFVLSLVTAVGGGTIRDVLVGRIPPFIFRDYNYIFLSLLSAVFVFFFYRKVEKGYNTLLIMDALGLGVFTVIGVKVGIDYQIGFIGSVFMGVMTGTFGGMIRDVLQGEVPLVLKREVYASASLLGGIAFLLMHNLIGENAIVLFVSILLVFLLRLLAIWRNWNLPRPK
ncbi:MAG: trimeric intracellular cation channel family protein [Calditerrivibrio sp.]|nr:trimeric intracellular cation channel family protein [Calditerrivibrio sp.]